MNVWTQEEQTTRKKMQVSGMRDELSSLQVATFEYLAPHSSRTMLTSTEEVIPRIYMTHEGNPIWRR